jgi:hypothetical protein
MLGTSLVKKYRTTNYLSEIEKALENHRKRIHRRINPNFGCDCSCAKRSLGNFLNVLFDTFQGAS